MAEQRFDEEDVGRAYRGYAGRMDGPEKVQGEVIDKEEKLNGLFAKVEKLKPFWEDFKTIFAMLKDVVAGRYTEVPWRTVAGLAGVLLYVLTPIDLIPDFLPGGFLDDAAMLALAIKLCGGDLANYREWKGETR